MDPAVPAIAVVVPTHRRPALLPRLVAALEAQRVDAPYEVVIVDDASGDETGAVLDRLAAEASIPLRVLRLDRNRGPAAARNAGWRATTAPVVAFTDDDCVPADGWLAALLGAIDDHDVLQGRTDPDPATAATAGPFSHHLAIDHASGRFETCNMAYRREVLERLGGFDERYRLPYGEDVDLGWRAVDGGATFAFVDRAVVHHLVMPSSFVDRVRRARRQEGIVQAVVAHPRLRSDLRHGVFVKPSHPPALLAAAGIAVALTGWPRAGAALAVPYLHHRVFRSQVPARKWTWPVTVPLTLVADLADVAVLAAASARHRTLVL